jgi:hypothetical protein
LERALLAEPFEEPLLAPDDLAFGGFAPPCARPRVVREPARVLAARARLGDDLLFEPLDLRLREEAEALAPDDLAGRRELAWEPLPFALARDAAAPLRCPVPFLLAVAVAMTTSPSPS